MWTQRECFRTSVFHLFFESLLVCTRITRPPVAFVWIWGNVLIGEFVEPSFWHESPCFLRADDVRHSQD